MENQEFDSAYKKSIDDCHCCPIENCNCTFPYPDELGLHYRINCEHKFRAKSCYLCPPDKLEIAENGTGIQTSSVGGILMCEHKDENCIDQNCVRAVAIAIGKRIENREIFICFDSIHLSQKSLNMLDPGKFCCDNIILYCIKRMLKRTDVDPEKVFIFDPLLLRNLDRDFNEHALKGLRRGMLNSLFDKEIIVYPFNIRNNHWVTFAVLNVLNIRRLCEEESSGEKDTHAPCIVLVDSIDCYKKIVFYNSIADIIRRHLSGLYENLFERRISLNEQNLPFTKIQKENSFQQEKDSNDCAIITAMNIEMVCKMLPQKITDIILPGHNPKIYRKQLRDEFNELKENTLKSIQISRQKDAEHMVRSFCHDVKDLGETISTPRVTKIKDQWAYMYSEKFEKFEMLDFLIFGKCPREYSQMLKLSNNNDNDIMPFIDALLEEPAVKKSFDLSCLPPIINPVADNPTIFTTDSAVTSATTFATAPAVSADDTLIHKIESDKKLVENKRIKDLFKDFGKVVLSLEVGEADIQKIGKCIQNLLIENSFMEKNFTADDRKRFTNIFIKDFISTYYQFPSEFSRSVYTNFINFWSSINKDHILLPRNNNDDALVEDESKKRKKIKTKTNENYSDEERIKALITVTNEVTVKAASTAYWKFKNVIRMRIYGHFNKLMDSIFTKDGEVVGIKRTFKPNTTESEGSNAKKSEISEVAVASSSSSSAPVTLANDVTASSTSSSIKANVSLELCKSKDKSGGDFNNKRTYEDSSNSEIIEAYETAKASPSKQIKNVLVNIKCKDKCMKILLVLSNIWHLVLNDEIADPHHITCIVGDIPLYNYIFIAVGNRHPKFKNLESIALLIPSSYDKTSHIFIRESLQKLNIHIKEKSKEWKELKIIEQTYNGDIRKIVVLANISPKPTDHRRKYLKSLVSKIYSLVRTKILNMFHTTKGSHSMNEDGIVSLCSLDLYKEADVIWEIGFGKSTLACVLAYLSLIVIATEFFEEVFGAVRDRLQNRDTCSSKEVYTLDEVEEQINEENITKKKPRKISSSSGCTIKVNLGNKENIERSSQQKSSPQPLVISRKRMVIHDDEEDNNNNSIFI